MSTHDILCYSSYDTPSLPHIVLKSFLLNEEDYFIEWMLLRLKDNLLNPCLLDSHEFWFFFLWQFAFSCRLLVECFTKYTVVREAIRHFRALKNFEGGTKILYNEGKDGDPLSLYLRALCREGMEKTYCRSFLVGEWTCFLLQSFSSFQFLKFPKIVVGQWTLRPIFLQSYGCI